MNIHLGIENKQQGPFSAEQVRTLFTEGRITRDTPAFQEGTPGWVKVADLPGIVPAMEIPPLPGAGLPPLPFSPVPSLPPLVADGPWSRLVHRGAFITSITTPVLWGIVALMTNAETANLPSPGAMGMQPYLNQVINDPSARASLQLMGLAGIIYGISLLTGIVFAIWALFRFGTKSRLAWIAAAIHAVSLIVALS